jgi:N-acetylmuramoyl-L-alanine amidase
MKKCGNIVYSLFFALIGALACGVIILFSLLISNFIKSKGKAEPVINDDSPVTIVIDAGHGGEDAGAIAPDNTYEKDLNLEISNVLCSLFELNGTPVKMTRTEDTLLYDYYNDLDNYKGKKKIYDLKNRLRIAEELDNSIYVGIHMNKFPIEKYSGMQIYYSKNNEKSQDIASALRDANKIYLQKDNKRQIKSADSSIFVLHNITAPAVLIECGFISNKNELALLKSSDYQCKLAITIFSAISNFT